MTLVTFTVIVGPPLPTEPTPNLTLRFRSLLMEPGLLSARPDNLEGWSSCPLRYRPIHDAKRSVPYPWKPRKSSVLLRAILGDGYTKKTKLILTFLWQVELELYAFETLYTINVHRIETFVGCLDHLRTVIASTEQSQRKLRKPRKIPS